MRNRLKILRSGKEDSVKLECLTARSRSHDVLEYTLQEWCPGRGASGLHHAQHTVRNS